MPRVFAKRLVFLEEEPAQSWADFKDAFGTFGEKVAYKQVAMYVATSYIANALSGCDVLVRPPDGATREEERDADRLYWLLNVSPNPNQSASEFMNALVTRLCTEGEALVVPVRGSLYLADGFQVERHPTRDDVFVGVSVEGEQLSKRFKASNAYHFRLESAEVARLVSSLYSDYGKLLSAATTGFVQGHGRKYKLRLPGVKAGDKTFAEVYEGGLKEQLADFMNSENAVYPQYEGYELEEMRHEAAGDSGDIIAMRKEVFDIVGQAYKIPTSMMYGNTNNTREVLNQFLTFAVDPVAKMMGDELTRKTYEFDAWDRGASVSVDTKTISHVDIFNVAGDVDKLISSGVFSIDDVLGALGYQPLGTEFGEAHFVTKNYEPAEDALQRLLGGGE